MPAFMFLDLNLVYDCPDACSDLHLFGQMHKWMHMQRHHAIVVSHVIQREAGPTSCNQVPLVSIVHFCLASLLR